MCHAGGKNQRPERIDAVVFNNDRTALIAVQGAVQDPGSRMTLLPVAQAQNLSMAQPRNRSNRASSANRRSNHSMSMEPEPAQSRRTERTGAVRAVAAGALALIPSSAVRAVPGAARYNPSFKLYS